MLRCILAPLVLLLPLLPTSRSNAENPTPQDPYNRQVRENLTALAATSPAVRARAAESLGFLRAYAAGAALAKRLRDDRSAEVRRNAALALAWCGDRGAVPPLLTSLDDRDWLAAQAAHVALTNLTGMEFPFNAAAPAPQRAAQAKAWRDWWAAVPPDRADGLLQTLRQGGDTQAAAIGEVLPAAEGVWIEVVA